MRKRDWRKREKAREVGTRSTVDALLLQRTDHKGKNKEMRKGKRVRCLWKLEAFKEFYAKGTQGLALLFVKRGQERKKLGGKAG